MQFCIATVQHWQSCGFDCINWRKSTDGTQAIVHIEYAQTLIPNIEADVNVQIYACPSDALNVLMNGTEWLVLIAI